MAWTEMQKKAIYTRGNNIIVSAGAGSGKTAVLSERILDYCLKGNDIRKLLVLTFTHAAAGEMKERIRKKLIANNLLEQASLIDSADITTFDAYSLGLVKKYYYKLDLDKEINIIDPALLAVKRDQIIDAVFEELYTFKDERFFSFLRKYVKQNDDNVKQIVIGLLDKLNLLVDPINFVNSYEKTYYSSTKVNEILVAYQNLVFTEFNNFIGELEILSNFASYDPYSEKLFDNVQNLLTICHSVNTIDDIFSCKSKLELGRVNSKSSDEVKEQKSLCSEILKELKEKYLNKYDFIADAKNEILGIKEDVLFLLELVMKIEQKLFEYKKSIMAFSYSDIARMAIRLVTEFADVHDEIFDNLNEILIDEYQDTSDIQEAFIMAISNNNCYMVGDIKQSIYRFRNANPYIFKKKYDDYSKNNNGIKIDLTHNFRSRKEVLENINLIFSSLMTDNCGDANYSLDHIMHYGQIDYELLSQNASFNMDILGYDSLDGFTDEEVEAFICANEIKKIVDSKVKTLKGKEFVDVTYNDIAILIDKTKSFVTFKKIFEYLGIPLAIEADLDLKDSILPKLFANILCLLATEDKKEKAYLHALASIGRSFLFAYSDTDIYKLINLNEETELTNVLDKIRSQIGNVSLAELFFIIVDEFNIYEKLPLIGDVANSIEVLDYIHSMFNTIDQAQMGLLEASEYFSAVFENGIDLKYKLLSKGNNCVHIMTIHKSKGLEFPYCIFPMLGSRFNDSDSKVSFGLSNKYGVYIPYSDEGNSDTIIKALEVNETRSADISEKVRLLYVALTRAREKMIFISNNVDYKDKNLNFKSFRCFNHMIRSLRFLDENRINVDLNDLNITKNYNITKSIKKVEPLEIINYDDESFISDELDNKHISKVIHELTNESLENAMALGIKFHACLEAIDFNNVNVDSLPVDDYIKVTLKQLLLHPVFKNIKNAKTFHEHEFYYNDYHGIIDLFCVYDDHIDIIDYKLSNIDDTEYIKQLGIYKEYICSRSNLEVRCYLLSILKKEIKRIS